MVAEYDRLHPSAVTSGTKPKDTVEDDWLYTTTIVSDKVISVIVPIVGACIKTITTNTIDGNTNDGYNDTGCNDSGHLYDGEESYANGDVKPPVDNDDKNPLDDEDGNPVDDDDVSSDDGTWDNKAHG